MLNPDKYLWIPTISNKKWGLLEFYIYDILITVSLDIRFLRHNHHNIIFANINDVSIHEKFELAVNEGSSYCTNTFLLFQCGEIHIHHFVWIVNVFGNYLLFFCCWILGLKYPILDFGNVDVPFLIRFKQWKTLDYV